MYSDETVIFMASVLALFLSALTLNHRITHIHTHTNNHCKRTKGIAVANFLKKLFMPIFIYSKKLGIYIIIICIYQTKIELI